MSRPQANLQISQGFEVLVPKGGAAYPVPCAEWDHLKYRLQKVSNPPWLFQAIGSLLFGGSVSTLIAIWTGSIAESGNRQVIAWAVVCTTIAIGLALWVLGWHHGRLQRTTVRDIVLEMKLIEERYERHDASGGIATRASAPV